MNQLETQLMLSAQNVLVVEAMHRMGRSNDQEFDQAVARYLATKERLVKAYARKRPKAEREVRPSMDEVCAYMNDKLGRDDPEEDSDWFLTKMAAQDWKVDGHPVKSWQALLRNWDRSGYINPKRGDDKKLNTNMNNRREMSI